MRYDRRGAFWGRVGMTSTKPFTMIAAIVFAIVALLHLYRLFTHFQVILGSHTIPMWWSYVGLVLPGLLAILLYRESRT
jgi:protein-S-isoprenylcysteine O-methyltransferase Ste14